MAGPRGHLHELGWMGAGPAPGALQARLIR
jgi:hypothetical protein